MEPGVTGCCPLPSELGELERMSPCSLSVFICLGALSTLLPREAPQVYRVVGSPVLSSWRPGKCKAAGIPWPAAALGRQGRLPRRCLQCLGPAEREPGLCAKDSEQVSVGRGGCPDLAPQAGSVRAQLSSTCPVFHTFPLESQLYL